MKIAFFHELSFGGARKTVYEFARELKESHSIDLFFTDEKEDSQSEELFQNVKFYELREKRWYGKNWKAKLYKDTLELFTLYKLHRKIAKEIDHGNYDFVFVHPSKFTQAPFILRFLTTPTIYFCQEPLRIIYDDFVSTLPDTSLPKFLYERSNRMVRKWIDQQNIQHAKGILANSRFSQRNIEKAYNKRSFVCYLGVNTSIFKPVDRKKIYDLVFVGSPSKIKGYDLLEETLASFRNKLKVKVVDGKNKDLNDYSLVDIYNQSKIVVALSRNEPFGLTVLEAMACDVPIVVVNEGGFKESVIHNKTGLLVERDAKAVYFALKRLLTDEKLRVRMGREGRAHTKRNWTWEKSAARFLEIVQICLDKK